MDAMPNDTVYSQIGGARIGWSTWLSLNVSIPFARITLASEAIALRVSFFGLGTTYKIERERLRAVQEYHGVFSKGIKIEHTVEAYPRFMVFWSRKADELKANLTGLGYMVEGVTH